MNKITKTCTQCSNRHATKWKMCPSCRRRIRANSKRWYEKNKDTHAANMRRCYERGKAYVHAYLKTNPCVDCGEDDYRVLEFDHVRGVKRMEISAMRQRAIKSIAVEIAKCDVRCANCHKRRHFVKGYTWYGRHSTRDNKLSL